MDPVAFSNLYSSLPPQNFKKITVDRNNPLPRLAPNERAEVDVLEFLWCEVPDDFSPQQYPNLRKLIIEYSAYNKELDFRGLEKLECVRLYHCGAFNQPIRVGNNPNLYGIDIARCGTYRQPLILHDLPALQAVAVTFEDWEGRPSFVQPLAITQSDGWPQTQAVEDESGALSEEANDLIEGAVTVRIKNCPLLNRFVFQGYIREADIKRTPDEEVEITGWDRPPLEVKLDLIIDKVPNLAVHSDELGNRDVMNAVHKKLTPTASRYS